MKNADQLRTELQQRLAQLHPNQQEFHQAVEEVFDSLLPMLTTRPELQHMRVFERLMEADRIISFRVCWLDDLGNVQINRAWRVQQSNLIGPYKGGLRFHPSVNASVLKFLAFEQIFKNALTGLPLGGGKGGADFDPRGKSDNEIMRFCQAFMNEMYRHIGPYTDVPAGDINVGSREIGYLYGQYRKIRNDFGGPITGKGIEYGGSHVRPQATGFGVVYMLECALAHVDEKIADKTVAISGAGNVASYAAAKVIQLGGKVISLSNSRGCLVVEQGFSEQQINWLIDNQRKHANVLSAFIEEYEGRWLEKQKPWQLRCDVALPCATQNELNEHDAATLVENGCKWVLEGANMPCTGDAIDTFMANGVQFVPGKAANAGGVAVSGLEMSQNASFEPWSFEVLDEKLHGIMAHIHRQCVQYGNGGDKLNYQHGANRAGFMRLANALIAQGIN